MKKYLIPAICAMAALTTIATVNATQSTPVAHPDHATCQQQNQGVIVCPACQGRGTIGSQKCIRCKGRGILKSNGMPLNIVAQ